LWIKATGLPAGVFLEDMTQVNEEPYFIYSFGQAPDGPAVTLCVERSAQNEEAEKILNLDKKAFAAAHMSEVEAAEVKDLQFTAAPDKISAYFTYPCQMATYTNQDMKIGITILFIQTDEHMFTVTVTQLLRDDKHGYIPDKVYGAADIEKWFLNLEMVEQ
jgi:hypothetical protein